jgi:hypothetical protein
MPAMRLRDQRLDALRAIRSADRRQVGQKCRQRGNWRTWEELPLFSPPEHLIRVVVPDP